MLGRVPGKQKGRMEGAESSLNIGSGSSQVVNGADRGTEMTPPAPVRPPSTAMAMSPTAAFSFTSTPMFNAKTFSEAAAATINGFHRAPLLPVLDKETVYLHVIEVGLSLPTHNVDAAYSVFSRCTTK